MTSVIVVEHQMNLTSTKKILNGLVNGNRKCINGYNLEVSLLEFFVFNILVEIKTDDICFYVLIILIGEIHNVYMGESFKYMIII